ncbi:purine-nucleoside phosphorylase [Sulfurovum sp.]|uniref:phosphorylase family protein n=1 Tax=Sulfurovum sp. TaxID=1969726 RepID=UPI0035635D9E
MIICAGESEQFDFALPVGIGMTDVAINLTRLCLSQKPKFILFVGTAGSYGEKKVFDIIESKTAANIENSFFTGGSYTPVDNMVSTAEDVSRETIVNSSNYITTDKNLGKAYLSKNIHLENMEYYAVLKVAKSFEIPAAGIFIVTNYCDENAHKNFMDNHKEAMLRLTEYIKESK